MNLDNQFSPSTNALQFIFRIPAPIVNGYYTWSPSSKVEAYPQVDISKESLYNFYSFSFSADIDVLDYQSSIEIIDINSTTPNANSTPTFNLYMKGQSSGPMLRQPIGLPNYYENVDYRFWKKPKTGSGIGSTSNSGMAQLTGYQVNSLQGSFSGRLQQVPSLIGKASVNMIFTLFAQEISDTDQQKFLLGKK